MAYKFQKGAFNADGLISGSSTIKAVGSLSSSGDIAVTGALHVGGILYGDGSGITDVSAGPAGSDTQLQYNNGGALGGASTMTFNDSTNAFTFAGTGSMSDINMSGALSGSGDLMWVGHARFADEINVSGTLSGAAALQGGDLTVRSATLSGQLSSSGGAQFVRDAYFGGGLIVTGASDGNAISSSQAGANFGGASIFGNNLSVSGTFTSKGDTQLAAAGVGTTVNGDLTVDQGATFSSTLTLAGKLSSSAGAGFVSSVSSSGDIAVTGAVHAAQFYGGGAGITGITATSLSGTLAQLTTGLNTSGYVKVSGSTTLAGTGSMSDINMSGALSGSGDLMWVGHARFADEINVSGAISGAAGLQFVADSVFGDNLAVSGAISLASAGGGLNFDGGSNVIKITNQGGGALGFGGPLFSFNNKISGSGDLEIVGDGVFGGNLDVSGNLVVGDSTSDTMQVKATAVFAGPEGHKLGTIITNKELTASSDRSYQIVSGGTSALTVIMPSASNSDYSYMIKRHSLMSGNVVIEGGGSEKIDGNTNITLSTVGASVFLISDGTQWNIF